ncbi:arsenate reductase (glutaredoxin) [Legionella londiniensis]|uniref:Arsenate reductase n=1 Tax=Legionella londiniensis TaxID=45068 RepID=A0A0W0VR04_9GAMM|nr:arsenate reductase (glutaredoxin) [Legionella londiniensis]KTD22572.1 oxidoreductase [Legionella londiniensis]STX92503.1 oxidoreductase [Legionella londiniensis]
METPIIYHNPRCSKSRQALDILRQHGIEPVIVEYLKSPPDIETLKTLSEHFLLQEFVRVNEPEFKELGLSLDDKDRILKEISKEPKLLQRPIVAYKGKAIIGRPPEKVMELFDKE